MNVVTGIVLYAIIWFLTLFIVLPLRLTSQGEAGTTVRGTHSSAPEAPQLGRKFRMTSIVAFVIWAAIAGVILSGAVTIDDIDLFTRFGGGQR